MKKTGLLFLTLMLSAALLCGCASNADSLASPSPGVNNSMAPQVSPGMTDNPNGLDDLLELNSPNPDGAGGMEGGSASGGISSLEDAKKASEEMGDAAIRAILYPPKAVSDALRSDIDHERVASEMERPGVTMTLGEHPSAGYAVAHHTGVYVH